MLAVNLTGTFLCARAVLADMLAQGWGRIILVGSTAGLEGQAYVAAYGAAAGLFKAAIGIVLILLANHVAHRLGEQGVYARQ